MATRTTAVLPVRIRAQLEPLLPEWVDVRWWGSADDMLALAPAAEIGWFDLHEKAAPLAAIEAALTRLKRMVMAVEQLRTEQGGDLAAEPESGWTQVVIHGELDATLLPVLVEFDAAMADDLNTPLALTALETVLAGKKLDPRERWALIGAMDAVLGLKLTTLTRSDLRLRPAAAAMTGAEIEAELTRRKDARAAKDFATSDAIRDALAAKGVEVMDGDPLGWEWKLG